jgi:hypothetical protein
MFCAAFQTASVLLMLAMASKAASWQRHLRYSPQSP